jgi:hypothetical protein
MNEFCKKGYFLTGLLLLAGTLFLQASCVIGPVETLTLLYTGNVMGEIEPCG